MRRVVEDAIFSEAFGHRSLPARIHYFSARTIQSGARVECLGVANNIWLP